MKKLLFITTALFLFPFVCFSQQDAQFSQFYFNQLYYNPAFAGVNTDFTEVTLLHRSQWAGYSSTFDDGVAPTTQVFSANLPIAKYNTGAGLHIVNDRVGFLRITEVQLSGAYHFKLKQGKLSVGVRGGVYNYALESKAWIAVENPDPVVQALLAGGQLSEIAGDFAIGVYFKSNSDRYFGGVSINHLQKSSFGEAVSFNELANHIYINSGANFDVSNSVRVTPSVLVKTDLNTYSIEGGILASYQDKYLLGTTLRETDAFSVVAGLFVLPDQKLRLSYSFDYVLSAQNVKETASHEIVLSYRLPAIKFYEPAPIRSPRFRFE